MKTTIKGNYSFRKPSKRKGTNALAFIGLILIFLSLVGGTQYFAWNVGKNRFPNELFQLCRNKNLLATRNNGLAEIMADGTSRHGRLHGQPDIDGQLCVHRSCADRNSSEESK